METAIPPPHESPPRSPPTKVESLRIGSIDQSPSASTTSIASAGETSPRQCDGCSKVTTLTLCYVSKLHRSGSRVGMYLCEACATNLVDKVTPASSTSTTPRTVSRTASRDGSTSTPVKTRPRANSTPSVFLPEITTAFTEYD